MQTYAFPCCHGYFNLKTLSSVLLESHEGHVSLMAKFTNHLSVQECLKTTMLWHFYHLWSAYKSFSFLQGQKRHPLAIETESTMASNEHRPKTRLSLRSSSTVRYGSMSSEQPDRDASSVQTTSISLRRSYIAVAVLCYINLLNYMDRYTIAGEQTLPKAIASVMRQNVNRNSDRCCSGSVPGVLLSIQKYFEIADSTSGLLQTGISLCL